MRKFIQNNKISLLALFISLGALILSYQANQISKKASGLTEEPRLEVLSYFKGDNKNSKPHFVLENVSTSNATLISINLYEHTIKLHPLLGSIDMKLRKTNPYDPYMIHTSHTPNPPDFYIKNLSPKTKRIFDLEDKILNKKYDPNILKSVSMIIKYYREVDKKEYKHCIHYYLNSSGRWKDKVKSVNINKFYNIVKPYFSEFCSEQLRRESKFFDKVRYDNLLPIEN